MKISIDLQSGDATFSAIGVVTAGNSAGMSLGHDQDDPVASCTQLKEKKDLPPANTKLEIVSPTSPVFSDAKSLIDPVQVNKRLFCWAPRINK